MLKRVKDIIGLTGVRAFRRADEIGGFQSGEEFMAVCHINVKTRRAGSRIRADAMAGIDHRRPKKFKMAVAISTQI